MQIVCKKLDYFKAINHVVNHLTESHTKQLCDKKFSIFCALVLLEPTQLDGSSVVDGKTILDMPKETREYFQAYCDGINSYVKNVKMLPL